MSINMRRNRDWYPKVPKIDSVKEWTDSFFYRKDVPLPNQATDTPPFQNIGGVEKPSWDERPINPAPGNSASPTPN